MEQLTGVLDQLYDNLGGYDPEDFIHAYGDPRQAILLFRLFCPRFAVVDENVVLALLVDAQDARDRLKSLLSDPGCDRDRVLDSYRWIEVPYIFSNRTALSDSQDEILANLVAEGWRGALAHQFPDRRFSVRVIPPDETGSVIGVGFYENRA